MGSRWGQSRVLSLFAARPQDPPQRLRQSGIQLLRDPRHRHRHPAPQLFGKLKPPAHHIVNRSRVFEGILQTFQNASIRGTDPDSRSNCRIGCGRLDPRLKGLPIYQAEPSGAPRVVGDLVLTRTPIRDSAIPASRARGRWVIGRSRLGG
jgi:hypothetical protein